MSEQEVETLPAEAPAPGGMLEILPDLLRQALAAGPEGVGALERLVALHATLRADQAREAFFKALAEFQAGCPAIQKNRTAQISARGGNGYQYRYADFERIVTTISPKLRDAGLSYSFDTTQATGAITVTCKLRHVLGHVETTTFSCPTSSPSGQMSEQQKVGGAMTFAKRYALVGALGIATADDDTDGVGEGEEEPMLEQEAVDLLETRLHELQVDRAKFLRYFQIELVKELPPSRLAEAHAILDKRSAR